MPIYEYQCGACGHHLEAFQKMTESVLTECPNCHKHDLQKLVSAAGFQLKGTGWYATDFRDQGKKKIGQPQSEDTGVEKKDNNDTKESKDNKESKVTKETKDTTTSNSSTKPTDTGTAAT